MTWLVTCFDPADKSEKETCRRPFADELAARAVYDELCLEAEKGKGGGLKLIRLEEREVAKFSSAGTLR